jgi:hypothetical protein
VKLARGGGDDGCGEQAGEEAAHGWRSKTLNEDSNQQHTREPAMRQQLQSSCIDCTY